LDVELVRRGLAGSREQARAAVEAGRVTVAGAPADKPSRMVSPGEPLLVDHGSKRFVSRGGEKLEAALDRFAIDVAGRRALDAGASTGGFTDCLLQRGAAAVLAVDVGRGQLHERLERDPRVTSLERTNLRQLRLDDVGGQPFDMVTADLSFISLTTVAPVLVDTLAAVDADVVPLIKPQFEAGAQEASRGKGVIREPRVWRRVLGEVRDALAAQGAVMMEVMVSPLTGADGNVEFLAHVRAHRPDLAVLDDAALDAVVAEAAG
jgi:23S rRNA (cytidine1920-2'-O)/16S rRNA (cytidine1409-2'-O)-methyltransferase